jgi:hypothetical protein
MFLNSPAPQPFISPTICMNPVEAKQRDAANEAGTNELASWYA